MHTDETTLTLVNPRNENAQTIARGNVVEIRAEAILSDKRRALGLLGGAVGGIAGAYAGGYILGNLLDGGNPENLGGVGIGLFVGMAGGAFLGSRAITRRSGELLYQAP